MAYLLKRAWVLFVGGVLLAYAACFAMFDLLPLEKRLTAGLGAFLAIAPVTLVAALVLVVMAIFVGKQRRSLRLYAVSYGVACIMVAALQFTGIVTIQSLKVDVEQTKSP